VPKILEATATRPLRALLVEESEADAELLLHEVKIAGFDLRWQRVETADAMRAVLARGVDIPFIIASPHDGIANRSTKG
jgi:hypothetical protein